jgi:hypothetical protein
VPSDLPEDVQSKWMIVDDPASIRSMVPGPRRPVSLYEVVVGVCGSEAPHPLVDDSTPSTFNASYYMRSLTPGASGRILVFDGENIWDGLLEGGFILVDFVETSTAEGRN